MLSYIYDISSIDNFQLRMAMMMSSSSSSSTGIDFLSIANPNPNSIPYLRLRRRPSITLYSSRSSPPPPPSLRPSSTYTLSLLLHPPKLNNHLSIFPLSAASHDQSKPSEIEVEKSDIKAGAKESEEAWKETLASLKEQALKMQSISQEAYELYSKKAIVVLKETSKQLKIEAEKAREDLSVIAQEISEEGKKAIVVLKETSKQLKIEAEKAREEISEDCKEIVEMFSLLSDELSKVSEVRDFHIGIPYGLLLSSGGFLNFMVTGSISAIRFGVILGGSLLALSVSSKRSWQRGETTSLALKGQAAIASLLFVRDLRTLIVRSSVTRLLTTLISGGIVAFYIYRVTMNGKHTNGSSLEPGMEN